MSKKLINLTIDGIKVQVEEGSTILEAARANGITIPTLCYLKDLNPIGACRMCLVEATGARGLVAACVYPVAEGMEVITNSLKVINARKKNLELLMSNHRKDCSDCLKSHFCKLREYAETYRIDDHAFDGEKHSHTPDMSSPCIIRDPSKCILCKKCIAVCEKQQDVGVIHANDRGFKTYIGCAFDEKMDKTACVGCGQCTLVCPTGALTEKTSYDEVFEKLNDPNYVVVCSPAPSVRVTLGEEFGLPIGTDVEGKMITALRRLGFKYIFDVDFAADLTIMEEGHEFLDRLNNGGKLPLITSCSPGWINYCTAYYPEFIPNLSTAKSPMQMQGAITKTYWAQKMGIDPKKIFTVHVMPCTAKKSEIQYGCDALKGMRDTDAVLTVRSLAKMIRAMGINFPKLHDGKFDDIIGESTGAGVIFGASGGVMEAALRTVADVVTGEDLKEIEYKKVRGIKSIKEATLNLKGKEVKVCAVSGLANARQVLEDVKSGKKQYHFIEIMCCPGGCVNGGGTPYVDYDKIDREDVIKLRSKALYKNDANKAIRKSHKNPSIIRIYKEFLEKPNSHKAHELLHRSYKKREFI
ncbi:MAG: [FeFe] hydrogenase, group A [Mycoplasma sp.]|nr:[FeFe] hydrogenase, group A [Candidatus Hennigella equi]